MAENTIDANGRYVQRELFTWVAPGIRRIYDDPVLQAMPVKDDAFQDWRAQRSCGEVVQAIVRQLPAVKREWLTMLDIRSILRVPVMIGGQWWATVGFDDCREERIWSRPKLTPSKPPPS